MDGRMRSRIRHDALPQLVPPAVLLRPEVARGRDAGAAGPLDEDDADDHLAVPTPDRRTRADIPVR
jgi:hypothetical protein